jgi:hypothetical protein
MRDNDCSEGYQLGRSTRGGGGLTDLLPSLRTGEGLVLGDALQVPSRIRIQKAPDRPVGDDPKLPNAWLAHRPDPAGYSAVMSRWRAQSTAATPDDVGENKNETTKTAAKAEADKHATSQDKTEDR